MSRVPANKARVAILGDTHGVLDDRIAEVARSCDVIVHTGDVGATEVLEQLEACAGEVIAVRGNNDVAARWKGDGAALRALPEEAGCDLPGGRLEVVHGHRIEPAKTRHARLRRRFPEARAIAYGHSHHLVRDRRARPWVLNPGAAGRSRTYGGPSCLVLTATPGRWQVRERRFPE